MRTACTCSFRKAGCNPISKTLKGLTIGSLTLSPTFNSAVTSYTTTTENLKDKVTATPTDPEAEIEIKLNGSVIQNGADANWVAGSNTLTIKVTGDVGPGRSSTTYTVTVTRDAIKNTLSGLTIGALTLTPTFASGTTSYTVTTSNNSNKVTATPTSEDAEITILLGEEEIENESSPTWEVGENTLTITVSGDAGDKTYTVVVTKESNP